MRVCMRVCVCVLRLQQSDEDISKEFKEAVAGAARSKLVKGLGYEAVPRYTVG